VAQYLVSKKLERDRRGRTEPLRELGERVEPPAAARPGEHDQRLLIVSRPKRVELAGELEDWLGQPVSATLTFDYPTVSAVATYLAAEPASAPAADAADVQALLTELDGPPLDPLSR